MEKRESAGDTLKTEKVEYKHGNVALKGHLAYDSAAFTMPESGDDPSKPAAYNEKADRRSWEAMKFFFREIFF